MAAYSPALYTARVSTRFTSVTFVMMCFFSRRYFWRLSIGLSRRTLSAALAGQSCAGHCWRAFDAGVFGAFRFRRVTIFLWRFHYFSLVSRYRLFHRRRHGPRLFSLDMPPPHHDINAAAAVSRLYFRPTFSDGAPPEKGASSKTSAPAISGLPLIISSRPPRSISGCRRLLSGQMPIGHHGRR